jgi:hypothetical protein
MHILLALILFGHGFAHLPGFLVFWKLATLEEMPCKTTILAGNVDIGDGGIRVVGILCLASALAFAASSIGTGGRRLPTAIFHWRCLRLTRHFGLNFPVKVV